MGDFEGTIPKGQYGGGTVQLWDRGTWAPEGDATPEEALAKGDLKFTLDGKRLHGSWVLVRMKGDKFGGKRNNWLLIKHRDSFARDGSGDAVLHKDRSVASGRAMTAIEAGTGKKPQALHAGQGISRGRDLAIGRKSRKDDEPEPAAKTRKVSSLPRFVEPQLAQLVEQPPSGAGWVHEVKFDGYRIQLRVEKGKAKLLTRKGLDWTARFSAIAKAAAKLPDCILDGEICALDHDGAPDFAALQAALSDGKIGKPDLLRLRHAVRRKRRPAPPAPFRAKGAPGQTA